LHRISIKGELLNVVKKGIIMLTKLAMLKQFIVVVLLAISASIYAPNASAGSCVEDAVKEAASCISNVAEAYVHGAVAVAKGMEYMALHSNCVADMVGLNWMTIGISGAITSIAAAGLIPITTQMACEGAIYGVASKPIAKAIGAIGLPGSGELISYAQGETSKTFSTIAMGIPLPSAGAPTLAEQITCGCSIPVAGSAVIDEITKSVRAATAAVKSCSGFAKTVAKCGVKYAKAVGEAIASPFVAIGGAFADGAVVVADKIDDTLDFLFGGCSNPPVEQYFAKTFAAAVPAVAWGDTVKGINSFEDTEWWKNKLYDQCWNYFAKCDSVERTAKRQCRAMRDGAVQEEDGNAWIAGKGFPQLVSKRRFQYEVGRALPGEYNKVAGIVIPAMEKRRNLLPAEVKAVVPSYADEKNIVVNRVRTVFGMIKDPLIDSSGVPTKGGIINWAPGSIAAQTTARADTDGMQLGVPFENVKKVMKEISANYDFLKVVESEVMVTYRAAGAVMLDAKLAKFKEDTKTYGQCVYNPYGCEMPIDIKNSNTPLQCRMTAEIHQSISKPIKLCLADTGTFEDALKALKVVGTGKNFDYASLGFAGSNHPDYGLFKKNADQLIDTYKKASESVISQWNKIATKTYINSYATDFILFKLNSGVQQSPACTLSGQSPIKISCTRDYRLLECQNLFANVVAGGFPPDKNFATCQLKYDPAYQALVDQTAAAVSQINAQYATNNIKASVTPGDPLLVDAAGGLGAAEILFGTKFAFGNFVKPIDSSPYQVKPAMSFTSNGGVANCKSMKINPVTKLQECADAPTIQLPGGSVPKLPNQSGATNLPGPQPTLPTGNASRILSAPPPTGAGALPTPNAPASTLQPARPILTPPPASGAALAAPPTPNAPASALQPARPILTPPPASTLTPPTPPSPPQAATLTLPASPGVRASTPPTPTTLPAPAPPATPTTPSAQRTLPAPPAPPTSATLPPPPAVVAAPPAIAVPPAVVARPLSPPPTPPTTSGATLPAPTTLPPPAAIVTPPTVAARPIVPPPAPPPTVAAPPAPTLPSPLVAPPPVPSTPSAPSVPLTPPPSARPTVPPSAGTLPLPPSPPTAIATPPVRTPIGGSATANADLLAKECRAVDGAPTSYRCATKAGLDACNALVSSARDAKVTACAMTTR
jgi:hypothetical protein